MRASPLFAAVLGGILLLTPGAPVLAQAAPGRTFRQWVGGQEVGGASQEAKNQDGIREVRNREWMALSRLGQEIRQEVDQTARRAADGSMTFTWRLQLSREPFEGRAEWTPADPGTLSLHPLNGAPQRTPVPAGALLWPEDLDARLMEAARLRRAVKAITFSFPVQQWNTLTLEPAGPDPLPGFPDAVRFTGQETQGDAAMSVEAWISPSAGELRQRSELGGLAILMQRAELPPPRARAGEAEGFFERTLQRLPPHPFQPWLRDLTLRGEGAVPELPEDAQQIRLGGGRWRLVRAALPSAAEAAQPPVAGPPAPGEARFLAPSPLVPFQDPAFDGLLRRLALPPGLSRWELARRVTTFVFDWITEKDYTVGFASALEVCRTPRGDCTEHGVLAVALLRRLGVPARGVTGWVGLGDTLGLHFWVEVKLGERWVPVDPTFDQAPASAFRIKLGDTDLSDLGSVGWESAALAFSGVRWIPEREATAPWGAGTRIEGDLVTASDGSRLRLPGGHWKLDRGTLTLNRTWTVAAAARPGQAQLKGNRRLAGPHTLREGWWDPAARRLWLDLGQGRWLSLDGVSENAAYQLLDQLMAPTSSS
ncbi:transglutaminase-like domain-containing protein [Geothrix oryzisoli]|uniref:transglutaminase-like domain-containing protein n=1 Tax=Geothrix oryzisoli TaxID=2922721 RepID=UPI001FABB3E2|nr:transglutaminase-like domain-containing protein [Geothrix oryzisoli]